VVVLAESDCDQVSNTSRHVPELRGIVTFSVK